MLMPVCFLYPWVLVFHLLFVVFYMKRMYITRDAVMDWRIYLLPFITLWLIFYESYWLIESFVSLPFSDYNKTT